MCATDDELNAASDLLFQAISLDGRGEAVEAERLYRQVLAIRQHHLGVDHPETRRVLFQLAENLRSQDSYSEAIALLEAHMGSDHESVLDWLDDHAEHFFLYLRSYPVAIWAYRRSLAIQENVFGADHPKVAAALSKLAEVLHASCEYEEAHECCCRALGIIAALPAPLDADIDSIREHVAGIRDELERELLDSGGRGAESVSLQAIMAIR